MTSVVIVGAKRSPIGNFNGALSSLSAHEIGAQVILDILQTSGIKNSDVTETILPDVSIISFVTNLFVEISLMKIFLILMR